MQSTKPHCFGDLEQVFPMTQDGLRHSPARCLACEVKSPCLKSAVAGRNRHVVAAEKLDRRYQSGDVSFLQRWSRKKVLHNRLTDNLQTGSGHWKTDVTV